MSTELPRTLVFIQEKGENGVAAREVMRFLRDAKFPLIDPALAHTAAQRQLVQAALKGDEGAAVELGRDFGAQVLIVGSADWGTAPDPLTTTMTTGTAEVQLRALRLDAGKVLTTSRASGRELDATEQMARTKAIRKAVGQILEQSEFVGALANNWNEEPWSTRGYFKPDPGSPGAALTAPTPRGAPRLAIIRTDVLPPMGTAGSRGIGVVKKADPKSGVKNDVRIEGVVVGQVASVAVEGVKAKVEPMDPADAKKLGIETAAQRFTATLSLPASQDTVKVTATSTSGETSEAAAAPRIAQRWAVIIGVSDYKSNDVTDLRFASNDAQSVYDFLRSPAAGPYDADHILLLKDAQATGQAMREALFVFLQKANYNDLVVVYFAGHGVADPTRPDNLYLLPHDADVKQLAATGFPMWDVKTALRRQIKAERVIVIADACHSGGASQNANPINGAFEDLFTPSRRVILTAADENELSYEDTKWGGGHGVFTFNLIEGLKGAADADQNGIVTFTEVSDYVAGKVKVETNGRQSPQRSGLGDIPLAEVAASVKASAPK
jgi:uncharacterized caspase-like protein